MTYRSADGILESRLEDLDRDLREVEARERELTKVCVTTEGTGKELAERLIVAGLGGGQRGPTFDRIGVLIAGLCIVGLLVAPFEISIGGYVRRQPEETVVPILLLAGPGVLAALIAWPYRRLRGYAFGAVLGGLLIAWAMLNVLVGWCFR